MLRLGNQRGEGRSGCLFWIFITLLVGMVAAKAIPVKIATMKLDDYMKDLAMTQPRKSQHFFEREIANRARELDLNIPKEQIKVKKYPDRVIMDVQFTVPIDILTFTYEWPIKIYLDRDIFLM